MRCDGLVGTKSCRNVGPCGWEHLNLTEVRNLVWEGRPVTELADPIVESNGL